MNTDEWKARWKEIRDKDRLPAMNAALVAAREYRDQARRVRNSIALRHCRLRLISALSRYAAVGEVVKLDGYYYSFTDDCKLISRKSEVRKVG